MTLAVGDRLGDFEILAPLGKGGMGEVWRARDLRLGREVAIKVVRAEHAGDPERRRRFEREAHAVATLNHPNILALHDIGLHDDTPYVVTELLEGETLRSRLLRGRLPAKAAGDIARQVALGLGAAHEKGVLHRDVKPENLWLLADGRVKILDFGIARQVGPAAGGEGPGRVATLAFEVAESTATGAIVGSVGYMSPEQLRGRPLDARSDLFALGVVLWEMVTGRHPFRGDSAVDTASAILRSDPPPFEAGLDVPPLLERVLERCLRKAPEERFQSARDLAFALETAVSGTDSSPTGLRAPARRATRGRWPKVAALGILAVLAVAALVRFGPRLTPAPAGPTSAAPTGSRSEGSARSLAVLPIANLSGDPAQAPIADGLTSTLINRLAGISDLRVVSYQSVVRMSGTGKALAEIARELGVDTVVEGSVHRDAEGLRFDARLVDARADRLLWARSYAAPVAEVFRVQGELARDLAGELGSRLSDQERDRLTFEPARNPEALEAYLRGRAKFEQFTAESVAASREEFHRALELDPAFADAAAAIAESYVFGPDYFRPTAAGAAEARRHAERALELDPSSGSAHAALAQVRFAVDWNWQAAEEGFRRAVRESPNSPHIRHLYSHLLLSWGRVAESDEQVRRMLRLDPASPASLNHLAYHHLRAGEIDEALAACAETLRLQPGYSGGLYHCGTARALRGEYAEAISLWESSARLSGVSEPDLVALRRAFERGGWRAYVEEDARQIEHERAEAIAAGRSPGALGLWGLAQDAAILGQQDRAFEALERLFETRSPRLLELREEPWFAPLRSDPRYVELERRIGFPPVPARGT